MGNEEFLRLCKVKVAEYTNSHMDKIDGKQITVQYVYVVWSCKTLQNSKALLSTTVPDGMYYELTYNGDKHELNCNCAGATVGEGKHYMETIICSCHRIEDLERKGE